MSATSTSLLPAAAPRPVSRVPQPTAGFAPKSQENGQSGAKHPLVLETGRSQGPAGQSSQLPAASPFASECAPATVETPSSKTSDVLHHADSSGAEAGEERALIAEGFALLVGGARSRHRGGRPKVIDAEMKGRIATLMGTGLSLRQAAACLGIAHTTISRAVADDPELKHDVDVARTRATLHPLACILRESGKNWKAAVWLLEHLNTVTFQEKSPLEKAEQNAAISVVAMLQQEITPRLLAEGKAALAAQSGQSTPSPSPPRRPLR